MSAIEIVCIVLSCIPIVCAPICISLLIATAVNLRRNDKAMGAYLDAKFKAKNPEIYEAFFGGKGGSRGRMNGKRLKALMFERGITQEVLARRVGITQGAITNYIKGRTPRGEILDKIADELGCEREFLLGEKDSAPGISSTELQDAAKPLIHLLREKGDPMMLVCVTVDRVDLYRAESGERVPSETEGHPVDH